MKKITAAETRDLIWQVVMGETSLSRMVEILNERVSEAEKKCVEDIPKRKFQEGDKVRIKHGISSKTVHGQDPVFQPFMDDFIGTTMTVNRYEDMYGYVICNESYWRFNEDWLEPYTDELKKGDLAIFWDYSKECALVRIYMGKDGVLHCDGAGVLWANAIKFDSVEQYEKLIKGEI